MSKSLEALERIVDNFGECEVGSRYYDLEFLKDINIIVQGLKHKEKLEKENEDLKAFVDSYANARDELLIKNEQLEKENKELKEQLQLSNYTGCSISEELFKEIEQKDKYKKAIEIIKNKPEVSAFIIEPYKWEDYEGYCYYNHEWTEYDCKGELDLRNMVLELTKEEYEILKEVLRNEIHK